MGTVRVKICGVRELEHARAAAEAGADLVGMVFAASSRRFVGLGMGMEIGALLGRDAPGGPRGPVEAPPAEWFARNAAAVEALLAERRPLLVGVFVNARAATVNQVADVCRLDLVQLSGDEPWEACREIRRPVIKAVRVRSGAAGAEVAAAIRPGFAALPLLDAHVEGEYGGTGRAFDWDAAREAAARVPLLLAGGLTPENAAAAVARVRPWGVDVSSGVETDGTKDPAKIRAFVAAVRAAGERTEAHGAA